MTSLKGDRLSTWHLWLFDSQDDSQHAGRPRTETDDHGMCELAIERLRTLMDGYGR